MEYFTKIIASSNVFKVQNMEYFKIITVAAIKLRLTGIENYSTLPFFYAQQQL